MNIGIGIGTDTPFPVTLAQFMSGERWGDALRFLQGANQHVILAESGVVSHHTSQVFLDCEGIRWWSGVAGTVASECPYAETLTSPKDVLEQVWACDPFLSEWDVVGRIIMGLAKQGFEW